MLEIRYTMRRESHQSYLKSQSQATAVVIIMRFWGTEEIEYLPGQGQVRDGTAHPSRKYRGPTKFLTMLGKNIFRNSLVKGDTEDVSGWNLPRYFTSSSFPRAVVQWYALPVLFRCESLTIIGTAFG